MEQVEDIKEMVTAEDIKKAKSDLTEEQFNKLIYYLSKDKLNELKELARIKVKNRFIKVMRKNINCYINMLYTNKKVKRETINLLNQSKKTLKNVNAFIKHKNIVDANALLRSSFENLIMGMVIESDINVYEEFKDLSITETTRNYTKPLKVRKAFRRILKQLDQNLFSDLSNNKLEEILDDFYNTLCLFTHSTIVVNSVVELEKVDNLDLYIFGLKQNSYFVEIILYLCLKYLNNGKKENLNQNYLVIGYCIIFSDIDNNQLTPERIKILKQLLYFDKNKDYFSNKKNDITSIVNEVNEFQKLIISNPLGIIEILKLIIK